MIIIQPNISPTVSPYWLHPCSPLKYQSHEVCVELRRRTPTSCLWRTCSFWKSMEMALQYVCVCQWQTPFKTTALSSISISVAHREIIIIIIICIISSSGIGSSSPGSAGAGMDMKRLPSSLVWCVRCPLTPRVCCRVWCPLWMVGSTAPQGRGRLLCPSSIGRIRTATYTAYQPPADLNKV